MFRGLSILFLRWIGNSLFLNSNIKVFILKCLILSIGRNVHVSYGVKITNTNVLIGDNVFLNSGISLNGGYAGRIVIEDNVQVGPNSEILAVTHKLGKMDKRAGDRIYPTTTIRKGCWIGARTTILPGVNVAEGCVVAAGSVVVRDTMPNGLYAGIPAVRKKNYYE